MGRKHRLTHCTWFLIAAALSCAVWTGCRSDDSERRAEERRRVLLGQNLDQQRNARLEKMRRTTYEGDLLPSDTQVAGIVLPRGFNSKFTFDHEWYYDGELPLAKLDKYFRERLESVAIEHPDSSATVFSQTKTKGAQDMTAVTVKIYPVPGREDWSRIHVLAPKPKPEHEQTAEEIRAMLAERAARAE